MPPFRRERSPADTLSDYREALLRGAPAEELEQLAASLDPELVALFHWTRETGRRERPEPDALFANRLERDLRQAFPTTAAPPGSRRLVPVPAPDSATPPESVSLSRPTPGTHPRWTGTGMQLAAAAVLALMLVGGLLLLRYATFERPQTQLGAVGEPTTETLVDATVTGAETAWTPLTVERWRFLPGDSTLSIPPLDGPQWIVADGGPIVATVDGQGQTLAPGQGLVVPAGQALELRNPSLDESSLYRGVAAAGFSLEEHDPALVTKEIALDTEAHESLPPGSSHIVFDRLIIPPGTTMKAEAATGQDWFDVVSGQLGLTLIGDALPTGWESGRERELTADEPIPILVPGTSVTMKNIGDDPLTILRLRVAPLSGNATATAAAG